MAQDNHNILYEEKQYLGYNRYSLVRRLALAIFCFFAYYFSPEMPEISGRVSTLELLFYMGIFILLLSVILLFILHIHTKVTPNSLILDGLWTARKVKIDLNSIISVEKIPYSRYLMNRPVYNLHRKGKIRFFTRGNDAVELIDRDGLKYIIGSQKAEELTRVLKNQITSNKIPA